MILRRYFYGLCRNSLKTWPPQILSDLRSLNDWLLHFATRTRVTLIIAKPVAAKERKKLLTEVLSLRTFEREAKIHRRRSEITRLNMARKHQQNQEWRVIYMLVIEKEYSTGVIDNHEYINIPYIQCGNKLYYIQCKIHNTL